MHHFHRTCLVRAVLLVVFAVALDARPAAAQAVTAASGSPEAIAGIRAEYAAIEREAPGYRRTEHDLYDFSLEGGVLHGFYRGRELRKLLARQYGETWRGTETYYFAGGRLIFIHTVTERYDELLSGRVEVRTEERFYLENGRLIRRIRTQRPAVLPEDQPMDKSEVKDLLEAARLFAACAAAPAGAERECTAPAR